jgi:streptomycin 6-kinase
VSPSIPARLLANAGTDSGWDDWLSRLPSLITELLDDWSLTPDGEPMAGATAYVVQVIDADQRPAALKIGYPHWEAEHEHLALRAWDGNGAIRLYRADPRRGAMLLERADHTRDLNEPDIRTACEIVAGLYPRLHRPAIPQLHTLSELSGQWAEQLQGLRDHPALPRRLVDRAASRARDFALDPDTDGRLIHTDLHFDNVLAADREPWLVIDPKPLSGDPAYEVAPLLWNRWEEAVATDDLRNAIIDRMYTVVDASGLDEDRVREWVLVRELTNVMYAIEGGSSPDDEWITMSIVIAKAVGR